MSILTSKPHAVRTPAALLVLLLGVAAVGPVVAELPPEGTFGPRPYVAREAGAPVRSEPGFLYREIRNLRAGQEVLIDERRGSWLHVRQEGWVFADHVRPRDEARETSRSEPAEPQTTRIRVVREGSRVRQGPGTGHPIVDTLSVGTELEASGVLDGWYVLGPGRYLFAELAEVVARPAAREGREGRAGSATTASPRSDGSQTTTWRVAAEQARIRESPAESAAAVATRTRGDLIEVSRIENGWAQVPGAGWVRQDLLDADVRTRGAAGSTIAEPPVRRERRRWSLMDLNGSVFEVAEFHADEPFVRSLRRAMGETGVLEEDWTFLRLMIFVPPGPYDFHFDPQKNDVIVTDRRGERYGNVYPRGPVERLPAPIRQFFAPRTVEAGERYEGVLLFRPTLRPEAIDGIEMNLGGRLQRLFDSPSDS